MRLAYFLKIQIGKLGNFHMSIVFVSLTQVVKGAKQLGSFVTATTAAPLPGF